MHSLFPPNPRVPTHKRKLQNTDLQTTSIIIKCTLPYKVNTAILLLSNLIWCYMSACVRVRACVLACVRACMCACVCVCVLETDRETELIQNNIFSWKNKSE